MNAKTGGNVVLTASGRFIRMSFPLWLVLVLHDEP